MIDVIENSNYPYVGLKWHSHWTSYARKFFVALYPGKLDHTRLEPGYLHQGKHNHETGWSSVIHAKATGQCMRIDDGTICGFGPKTPEELKSLPSKSIYVVNGLNAKGNPNSAYPSILSLGLDEITYFTYIQSNTASKAVITIGCVRWIEDSSRPGYVNPIVFAMQRDWSHTRKKWSSNTVGTLCNVHPPDVLPFPRTDEMFSDIMMAFNAMHYDVLHYVEIGYGSPTRLKATFDTPYYIPGDASGILRSDDDIIRGIRREFRKLYTDAHDFQEANIMKLQATSFDSINRFDGNMLAFLADLPKAGRSSIEIFTNLAKAKSNPRKLASAWLSARYGDRLTYSDLKELLHGFSVQPWHYRRFAKFLLGRGRSSGKSPDGLTFYSMNCEIAVTPNDYNSIMRAIRHAYEWDYYPTLGNIWDLIPLSFVVDWFVDVSSIFEDIDRLVQSRYYDVVCVLNTIKASRNSQTFLGVRLSYYDRSLTKRLSLGMSSVSLGLPSSINIVDGVSLILM